jgi:hypothetical protein
LTVEGWELDGSIFHKGNATYLPLYEAKMAHYFDHRWATYDGTESRELSLEEKRNPHCLAMPRYWVPSEEVAVRLKERWEYGWLVGWRDMTRNTDKRTLITSLCPAHGVGHKFLSLLATGESSIVGALYGNSCSLVLDYAARQKLGGTSMGIFVLKQLPILQPEIYGRQASWTLRLRTADWLLSRIVELTYTSWDLQPFAKDCGQDGPPFRWDEERRFHLRCELDAAYFHLYLGSGEWRQSPHEPEADFAKLKEAFPTPRTAVEYIIDSFSLVRDADEQKHGRYRTKEQILAVYDALAEAVQTGEPYRTPLDPPPADARCRHAALDGSLAPGAVCTLPDLISGLPESAFPLRLSEADIGPGQPTAWTCRPIDGNASLPKEDTWVVIRDAGLLRGSMPVPIAAGRLALNPIAGGMEVLLKGAIPPARLRLSQEEWQSFRPLAVLEPLSQPE